MERVNVVQALQPIRLHQIAIPAQKTRTNALPVHLDTSCNQGNASHAKQANVVLRARHHQSPTACSVRMLIVDVVSVKKDITLGLMDHVFSVRQTHAVQAIQPDPQDRTVICVRQIRVNARAVFMDTSLNWGHVLNVEQMSAVLRARLHQYRIV